MYWFPSDGPSEVRPLTSWMTWAGTVSAEARALKCPFQPARITRPKWSRWALWSGGAGEGENTQQQRYRGDPCPGSAHGGLRTWFAGWEGRAGCSGLFCRELGCSGGKARPLQRSHHPLSTRVQALVLVGVMNSCIHWLVLAFGGPWAHNGGCVLLGNRVRAV